MRTGKRNADELLEPSISRTFQSNLLPGCNLPADLVAVLFPLSQVAVLLPPVHEFTSPVTTLLDETLLVIAVCIESTRLFPKNGNCTVTVAPGGRDMVHK